MIESKFLKIKSNKKMKNCKKSRNQQKNKMRKSHRDI